MPTHPPTSTPAHPGRSRRLRVLTLIDGLGVSGGGELFARDLTLSLDSERFERIYCVSRFYPEEASAPAAVRALRELRDQHALAAWAARPAVSPSALPRPWVIGRHEAGIFPIGDEVLLAARGRLGRRQRRLPGDGDALDAGEQSPQIHTQTVVSETADPAGQSSDTDGITPGQPIPDHLRIGIYHNPSISCPSPGCSVDVDNVQVVG